MRVLIVDDSRSMRMILKRILAELGHTEVREAIEDKMQLMGLP